MFVSRIKICRFVLIYINFSFDFLGLDYVYFKNYFANELIRWVAF
jgi:hypothetical protein